MSSSSVGDGDAVLAPARGIDFQAGWAKEEKGEETEDSSLLLILVRAMPTIVSYRRLDKIVQANAEGARVLCRHSERREDGRVAGSDDGGGGDCGAEIPNGYETELFVKRVSASSYAHKPWTDLRRTLMYLRTEVRFYGEFAPRLVRNGLDPRRVPACLDAACDLRGLVGEGDRSTDISAPCPFGDEAETERGDDHERRKERALEGRGGHLILQSFGSGGAYFQDSPLTLARAAGCLRALADLHAAAWGDVDLLRDASDRLSGTGGSYHLRLRNPVELRNMVESWAAFRAATDDSGSSAGEGLLDREGVIDLGRRVKDMAEYVSDELSPRYADEYATIVHGDFKAMNIFIPADENKDDGVVLIDFSCAGIGYGMSDVAMHLAHAVRPEHLQDGGEERLVEGYLEALEDAVNRKLQQQRGGDGDGDVRWTFPREVAWRQYRLGCVDYLRFILGRFWRTGTLESFEKRKRSKNTTLINRNLDAAMSFIEKVDGYLTLFEKERKDGSSL